MLDSDKNNLADILISSGNAVRITEEISASSSTSRSSATDESVPPLTNKNMLSLTSTNEKMPPLSPANENGSAIDTSDMPPLVPANDDMPPLLPANEDMPPLLPANDDLPPLLPANGDMPPLMSANDEMPPLITANEDLPHPSPANQTTSSNASERPINSASTTFTRKVLYVLQIDFFFTLKGGNFCFLFSCIL